ncbi:MAG: hypothetical protein AAFN18_15670 [Cyanobacteria bacterium J06554_6]
MTMPDTHLTALLSQHTLQSDDLLLICELANVDGIENQIDSWSFEQFFGLAVYLFVTTESSHTRRQLAQVLPKFGSRTVLSLVKILHQHQLPTELRLLALQSIEKIPPYALTYGLTQVLETDNTFEPFVLRTLASLIHERDESILLLLSQLLTQEHWHALEPRLLERLPYDEAIAFDPSLLTEDDNVESSESTDQLTILHDAAYAA